MIIRGDCLEVMKDRDENSIDLIVTDPPYFKVKNEWWDRQWDNADKFIEWIGLLCEQWYRILKPNGSLYVFASPKMAARVEIEIGKTFNVMNRIRWQKEAGWHNKVVPADLRSYLSPWEEIIFADHYNSDNAAKSESGYGKKCDELKGFVFEPLRMYLANERKRAGVDKIAINVACGFSATAGGMASRHYFSQSQWCLPTKRHYKAMQKLFNPNGNNEYLKREYDDLKREYEKLRRPFNATPETQYTDVWTFPTVSHFKGKHPCEKPIELIDHIIRMSSNEGAVILDCFMGRGTTLEAARNLNRQAIGIEISEKWCKATEARLSQLRMDV